MPEILKSIYLDFITSFLLKIELNKKNLKSCNVFYSFFIQNVAIFHQLIK